MKYKTYATDLKDSQKRLNKWQDQSDQIVKRYLGNVHLSDTFAENPLNLFHSNITTVSSQLYGNLPTVDVSRRYADSKDDVSRVAGETLERLLNLHITDNNNSYDSLLRSALLDRLLSGMGVAKVRYEVEYGAAEIELEIQLDENGAEIEVEVETPEVLISEDAPLDYVFYGDVLWSWGRNWDELTWIAYREYLTKDEVSDRFGAEAADELEYKQQAVSPNDDSYSDPDLDDPTDKAEIWEIWDKTNACVAWISFGYQKILEKVDDFLGLKGFFPSPPFLIANPTTSLYIPTPDFLLAQDLYDQVDILQMRIQKITSAVKIMGFYDKGEESVQRLFTEGVDNTLIPVDNWALFSEKGGTAGVIDYYPAETAAMVLQQLQEVRDNTIQLIQQVTGMSDISRGQLDNQYEGVGQSQLKAKMGSVRMQALQEEFASFASNLLSLKAEVIAKHFSPETIVQQSNMGQSSDVNHLPAAIDLIKNPEDAKFKIVIRSEKLAMTDYASLQNERTEFLGAIGSFLQMASPLIEADPDAKPYMLEILQWGLSGFKGSSEIEGVLDRAISASEKKDDEPEPPEVNPAVELEQMKVEGTMAIRNQDKEADIETIKAEHQVKLIELRAATDAKLAEIDAKSDADVKLEMLKAEVGEHSTKTAGEVEIAKDVVEAELKQDGSV